MSKEKVVYKLMIAFRISYEEALAMIEAVEKEAKKEEKE